MFVPTDNQPTATGQGAGDKLVIVRVRTDGLTKGLCLSHFGLDDHQFQQPCDDYPMVLLMQDLSDPSVFFKGLRGQYQLNTAVSPSLKDTVWWSGKENSGNEYVGVQNDSHLRPRA
jgi:hypothetical protein